MPCRPSGAGADFYLFSFFINTFLTKHFKTGIPLPLRKGPGFPVGVPRCYFNTNRNLFSSQSPPHPRYLSLRIWEETSKWFLLSSEQQTASPVLCSCLGWVWTWAGIASTDMDTDERRVLQLPTCAALVFLNDWSLWRGTAPRLSGHDPLAVSHRSWWAFNILKCQRTCISPSGDETFLQCSQACKSGVARGCRALLFSFKSTCNSWAVSPPVLKAAQHGDPSQQTAVSVSAASL